MMSSDLISSLLLSSPLFSSSAISFCVCSYLHIVHVDKNKHTSTWSTTRDPKERAIEKRRAKKKKE